MNIVYAVEANSIIEEVPEFKALVLSDTNIIDFFESIYIYESESDAVESKNLLLEAELFENQFELILTSHGVPGETFTDFGFITSTRTFLLKEMVCVFSICVGAKEEIEMALFQLEEHLIFKTVNEEADIFFVEKHLKELVKGIANAYDIEVSFFELDKQRK
ncbi:hypothetical protein RRV45_15365 [Bacillus sp. DTU_2020_1000418_1_SI_GHA_SEK_038]|uniref:hypothetical protein n=1 Tax=Bacillus sp. DTU_2020_1000418_1_SI_GHA_SEK_038 TaxID=3077585 RepID=UPI0028E8F0FA|nr:hypothetical protein [Bacillus sp. DTU_2020_1000418_1_SI_GHA_SEK_038]WNS74288.1 hypothetical protein RRV45_15365 [Bacillus sp. DTU_2020_1000418_1_SI_GHA_SEK_038]